MSNTINAVGMYSYPKTESSGGLLGKDDFLKMLVMQLRYQDPLNPMKGTEFASQLAQFSSVEQLSNINSSLLTGLEANQLLSQSISNSLAATIIGKDVRASGNAFSYSGSGDARLGYSLSSAAEQVTVKILDQSGSVVRTLNVNATSKGDNSFTWDGKSDDGRSLSGGKYSFTVEAKDSKGGLVQLSRYVFGNVSAVRFKADGAVFVVDGMEISLSDVLEIMQG
jgi:flagellar basal-body rod modification protein FlgD